MANPYVYYVLTFDGASLMAQATATNQIVFVGAISKATAASSDEDLASKGKSWYDGKTGEIDAVSATNAVAKIVCIFTASGARQDAKSIAITARLASQSDADAVVFCAKSDPDATAILPGSTDTMADVRFPFNISINASGTVQVTPGASASVADLARFVSLHKAGDPTRGDDQNILGEKTFVDKICADYIDLPANSQAGGVQVNANIVPTEDNVFGLGMVGYAWEGVRAWEIHTTELKNDLDSGAEPILVYSSLRPSGNISLGDSSHRWRYLYANTVDTPYIRTESSELNIDCKGSTTGYLSEIYLFCDDPTYPGARITLQPQNGSESQYNFSPDEFHAPGKNLGYAGGGEWQYLFCGEVVTAQVTSPGRECTLKASQSMIGEAKFICDLDSAPVKARIYVEDHDDEENTTFYFDYAEFYAISSYRAVDLGSRNNKFGTVYAIDFRGRIPTVDGNTEPEVGAIFFAGIEVAGALNAGIGRTAKVGSPLIPGGNNVTAIGSASWDTQATDFSSYTPFATTAGTYKLLCGATKTGSEAACFALVMRIA